MYNFSNITSIYVSQQNGNDGFNGFMPIANADSICGGPLKTIDKALEMVSEMRTANAAQPVRIVIMGDYYVPYTLTISGNIADVEFESYSESRARIIGGVKLDGADSNVSYDLSYAAKLQEIRKAFYSGKYK